MFKGLFNTAAALALLATPALATDLKIDVSGQANGTITIHLLDNLAPQAAARLVDLANQGAYDGVVFHRVIDGFMAQTGDVEFAKAGGDLSKAGMGGSTLPNLPAEFSDHRFTRGTVGMARAQDPNSANSQFFIMFADGDFLDGKYTVVGEVTSGMDVVDKIKRGRGQSGTVAAPQDVMTKVTVTQ